MHIGSRRNPVSIAIYGRADGMFGTVSFGRLGVIVIPMEVGRAPRIVFRTIHGCVSRS